MFDTGIGFDHAEVEAAYKPGGTPLLECLRARGVMVADIHTIVNSHLHFDHCGQNNSLPSVPAVVQKAELGAARQPDYTVNAWVFFPTANYKVISGDFDLEEGITVVSTPGHTPGHQSLFIQSLGTSVLLAGQACYSPGEWEGREDVSEGLTSAPDPVAYKESLDRLRELEPDVVWFSHAVEPWLRDSVGDAAD
jgi:N-acyl homoserine lactone hydrolase